MNPSTSSEYDLGQILANDDYLRERLRPRWRDMNYLVFHDLRVVIESFAKGLKPGSAVFDYGCGGAPYESLFDQASQYVRADIVPGPRVQRAIRPDGLTDEPPDRYEAVLSTQVLEHVPEPREYLAECLRILKPGGEALITTHGMFEEHGCPHDYTRWTIAGLERIARQVGFEVSSSHKTTTQIRGSLYLLHYFVETLRQAGPRTFKWYLFDFMRRIYRRIFRPVINALGSCFPKQGVVPGNDSAAIYVGITLKLKRPVTWPVQDPASLA